MKKVTIFPAIAFILSFFWELDAQTEYPEAMVGISHAYYTSFDSDNPFVKAAKNIKNIEFIKVDGINVYDILNNQKLIITKDSLNNIVERCQ